MAQRLLRQNFQLTRIQQPVNSSSTLRGTNGRLASGMCLIVTGFAEIIIAGYLISRPINTLPYSCRYPDRVAWGIWGGVFAVITGCFGTFSRRSRCVVIAFLVLGIIEAVLISPPGIIIYLFQTVCETDEESPVELGLYASMLIMSACQFLMSIIGASFTCVAICSSNDPMAQQLIINDSTILPYQTIRDPSHHGSVTSTNGQHRLHNSYGHLIISPSNQIATIQYQPIVK